MEPLVTVAVAAYNVEKFLKKGMKYVTGQTYRNLDIILVDDGSTDRTSQLCDELAEEDSRIRVFHKDNGGLGSARNVGIEQAKGEYICFFDVDDSLEPDYIADCVRYAEEKQSDLIIFGYYARYDNSENEELIGLQEREIHENRELKEVFCNELLWMEHGNGFAWNKFYRISFLREHNFRFGNERIQQDEPFNLQLYPVLENVYICPRAYYHYVIYSKGNAASRYLPEKADIIADVYHKFMAFYEQWGLDDKRVLNYIRDRYISGVFNVATGTFFHEDCRLSAVEKHAKIDQVLHRQELVEVLKTRNPSYGSNPVNNMQIWAFYRGRTRTLIEATRLKRFLKKLR